MILSIGEILVDMIDREGTGYVPHLGGAPFNVAVGVTRAGGQAAFCGSVGRDTWGDFVKKECAKYGVDTHLTQDPDRNTTLAFVKLDKGERSFGFVRKNGADAFLDADSIQAQLANASILHIGSLPLSEETGRAVVEQAIAIAKAKGIRTSFDVNLRECVWADNKERDRVSLQIVKECDLVKLNEEEWNDLPEMEHIVEEYPGKAIVVTLGAEGAILYKDGYQSFVPSIPVEAIDTTGAGDAFWGSLLAQVDQFGKDLYLSHEDLVAMIEVANEYGARAVSHFGAI